MRSPLVTVVIPTYNAAEYLGSSISSAIGQTYTNMEILVLDNASTDNTMEVVASLPDSRMVYIRNDENIGFAGNANLGLEMAKGKYLCYLGADDIWHQSFLQEFVDFLENHQDISFVHGSAIWIDENGNSYGGMSGQWNLVTTSKEAFINCFKGGFCFSTMVMRKDLVEKNKPIDQNWKEIADSWLFLKLCLEGNVGYIDEPLVWYRVHQKSLSLALYANGALFENHFKAAREAFNWEEATRIGLDREMNKGLRNIAEESFSILQIVRRDSGRIQYLKIAGQILKESPTAILLPKVWLRIVFSMLPKPVIMKLSQLKKAGWRKSSQITKQMSVNRQESDS